MGGGRVLRSEGQEGQGSDPDSAPPSEWFDRSLVLEGNWGLLFCLLIVVPFLVVALNPAARTPALTEIAVAGVALGVPE